MIATQMNDRRQSVKSISTVTSRHRSRTTITAILLFAAMVLMGCGESANSETSDADGADDSSEQSTGAVDAVDSNEAAASNGVADGNDDWDDDDKPWRSEDVEYSAAATGLKVALSADRVEVDGTTFHIYLKDDARIPGGPCLIAQTTLPDDATAIVYQDGTETPC